MWLLLQKMGFLSSLFCSWCFCFDGKITLLNFDFFRDHQARLAQWEWLALQVSRSVDMTWSCVQFVDVFKSTLIPTFLRLSALSCPLWWENGNVLKDTYLSSLLGTERKGRPQRRGWTGRWEGRPRTRRTTRLWRQHWNTCEWTDVFFFSGKGNHCYGIEWNALSFKFGSVVSQSSFVTFESREVSLHTHTHPWWVVLFWLRVVSVLL